MSGPPLVPPPPETPPQPVQQKAEEIRCLWKDCGRTFDSYEDLYRHLCDDHVGRKSKGNLCLTCGWLGCDVTTSKRDHMTSHMRVHIDEKPHRCPFCGKRLKRIQHLRQHLKLHMESDSGTRSSSRTPAASAQGESSGSQPKRRRTSMAASSQFRVAPGLQVDVSGSPVRTSPPIRQSPGRGSPLRPPGPTVDPFRPAPSPLQYPSQPGAPYSLPAPPPSTWSLPQWAAQPVVGYPPGSVGLPLVQPGMPLPERPPDSPLPALPLPRAPDSRSTSLPPTPLVAKNVAPDFAPIAAPTGTPPPPPPSSTSYTSVRGPTAALTADTPTYSPDHLAALMQPLPDLGRLPAAITDASNMTWYAGEPTSFSTSMTAPVLPHLDLSTGGRARSADSSVRTDLPFPPAPHADTSLPFTQRPVLPATLPQAAHAIAPSFPSAARVGQAQLPGSHSESQERPPTSGSSGGSRQ